MDSLNISTVDVILIIVIVFITARAVFRGFIAEFISVASVLGGIIAGFIFSSMLTNFVSQYLKISWWNKLISFLVIFLVIYIILKFIEKLFHNLIEKVELQRLDRSLGLFLGLFESCLIILFFVTIIDAQPFFSLDKYFSDSIIVEYARKIISVIPENNIMNHVNVSWIKILDCKV